MDFSVSELTLQVAQTARDFAQQRIKPDLMTWDESQEFPVHIFKEMGQLNTLKFISKQISFPNNTKILTKFRLHQVKLIK